MKILSGIILSILMVQAYGEIKRFNASFESNQKGSLGHISSIIQKMETIFQKITFASFNLTRAEQKRFLFQRIIFLTKVNELEEFLQDKDENPLRILDSVLSVFITNQDLLSNALKLINTDGWSIWLSNLIDKIIESLNQNKVTSTTTAQAKVNLINETETKVTSTVPVITTKINVINDNQSNSTDGFIEINITTLEPEKNSTEFSEETTTSHETSTTTTLKEELTTGKVDILTTSMKTNESFFQSEPIETTTGFKLANETLSYTTSVLNTTENEEFSTTVTPSISQDYTSYEIESTTVNLMNSTEDHTTETTTQTSTTTVSTHNSTITTTSLPPADSNRIDHGVCKYFTKDDCKLKPQLTLFCPVTCRK